MLPDGHACWFVVGVLGVWRVSHLVTAEVHQRDPLGFQLTQLREQPHRLHTVNHSLLELTTVAVNRAQAAGCLGEYSRQLRAFGADFAACGQLHCRLELSSAAEQFRPAQTHREHLSRIGLRGLQQIQRVCSCGHLAQHVRRFPQRLERLHERVFKQRVPQRRFEGALQVLQRGAVIVAANRLISRRDPRPRGVRPALCTLVMRDQADVMRLEAAQSVGDADVQGFALRWIQLRDNRGSQ